MRFQTEEDRLERSFEGEILRKADADRDLWRPRLLAPIARLLVKYAPGDAYSDPWSELAKYGPVETKRFLLDFFYVSSVTKQTPAGTA